MAAGAMCNGQSVWYFRSLKEKKSLVYFVRLCICFSVTKQPTLEEGCLCNSCYVSDRGIFAIQTGNYQCTDVLSSSIRIQRLVSLFSTGTCLFKAYCDVRMVNVIGCLRLSPPVPRLLLEFVWVKIYETVMITEICV